MGKYLNEMKIMTVDPACLRLGEIADEVSARLEDIEQRCSHSDASARPPAPDPGRHAPLQ
jgi:hypothetical protein